MTKDKSDKIIKKLHKHYGKAVPDLKFAGLYQLAVSVVLSAQTTDSQVNAVTPELFKNYPGFVELSEAGAGHVEKIIRSTGFYRNKTKNIIALAKEIMISHAGKLPSTREELMRLPGIGRKSANVILSVGFGIPALAVDTHILRIANRLGYCNSDNPDEAEIAITSLVPEKLWTRTHLVLIKHGRMICKAKNPLCAECPIRDECFFDGKTS